MRPKTVEKSQIRVKAKVVDSSCPTENRQWRKDAARAVPPREAKIKIPVQRVQKKNEILQSQLAQETMRSEIRRMKLKKTFGEQKELSVRLLSGLSTKQPVIKNAVEMQAEAERRRRQNDINLASGKQPDRDSVEQHPPVQDPGAQARQQQKAHKRSTKHVSDGTNEGPRRPTKRKTFSKSEAELVDVMDTLQT